MLAKPAESSLFRLYAGRSPRPVTGCFLPAVNDSGAGRSILPGWNGKKGIVRRRRTVYVLSDEAKQSPEVHQRQDSGTEPVAQQKVGNALHANSSSQAPYHSLFLFKAKLIHYAARPLPTKSSDFCRGPRELHRQGQGSSRSHSCSTDGLAF